MKPTSKTPYEIRLELLQLAQSILMEQLRSNPARIGLPAPTSDEVIAEAERLNSFVSKTN